MFPVNFDKTLAQHFNKCLEPGGGPIGTVEGVDEIVSLAGACYFALHKLSPLWRATAAQWETLLAQSEGLDREPLPLLPHPQHPEHDEADQAIAYHDMTAAIEYIGLLARLVDHGAYDDRYEERMACLVGPYGREDTTEIGTCLVKPIDGFKQAEADPLVDGPPADELPRGQESP